MYYQNLTVNIMSLGGIAVAIGAMVDAAIILIENVHKLEAPSGDDRLALLAVTLTPALAALLIRGKIRGEEKNPLNRWLIAAYVPLVRLVVRFRKTAILLASLLVPATVPGCLRLGTEFMRHAQHLVDADPDPDRDARNRHQYREPVEPRLGRDRRWRMPFGGSRKSPGRGWFPCRW